MRSLYARHAKASGNFMVPPGKVADDIVRHGGNPNAADITEVVAALNRTDQKVSYTIVDSHTLQVRGNRRGVNELVRHG